MIVNLDIKILLPENMCVGLNFLIFIIIQLKKIDDNYLDNDHIKIY